MSNIKDREDEELEREIIEAQDDLAMAIKRLTLICGRGAANKGFHEETVIDGMKRKMSATERMALMHSEITEMLEAYRNDGKPGGLYHEVDGKPCGAASELADLVIRALDYAYIYNIPLGTVIMAKLAYNTTRSQRHGGRVI